MAARCTSGRSGESRVGHSAVGGGAPFEALGRRGSREALVPIRHSGCCSHTHVRFIDGTRAHTLIRACTNLDATIDHTSARTGTWWFMHQLANSLPSAAVSEHTDRNT